MSHTYAEKKRADVSASHTEAKAPQPSVDTTRFSAAQTAQAQMGHRVDLPDAMREKMENAFGADLSAVKLYESEAVADAGAKAVTRGSDIAFAPGLLDFSSFGGQSLLGHELSHVVSQARGEVTGGGFLNDHALEARADREGAMAAAGQQIAMPTAAVSTVSAASAAGPMQAKKDEEQVPTEKALQAQAQIGIRDSDNTAKGQSFRSAMERYNASRGDLPEFVMDSGDTRTQRFLQRHMTGTDDENDALFRDVMTRGDAAMMPTFAQEARRMMEFDPSNVQDDSWLLQHGGELISQQNDTHNLMDMISDQRVRASDIGFSDEEFAQLAGTWDPAKKKYVGGKKNEWATGGGMAQVRLKQMGQETQAKKKWYEFWK